MLILLIFTLNYIKILLKISLISRQFFFFEIDKHNRDVCSVIEQLNQDMVLIY